MCKQKMESTQKMKIVEVKDLFDSTDKKIRRIEEPAILVLTEPSLTTAGPMPTGKESRGYYLFDGGLLQPRNVADTYNIKNVVFPTMEWAKDLIDKYGFSDPKKRLWFFIPSNIREDNSGAYWIRKNPMTNPQFVQYVEAVRSKPKELKKLIKKVLVGIAAQTLAKKEEAEPEETEETEEEED